MVIDDARCLRSTCTKRDLRMCTAENASLLAECLRDNAHSTSGGKQWIVGRHVFAYYRPPRLVFSTILYSLISWTGGLSHLLGSVRSGEWAGITSVPVEPKASCRATMTATAPPHTHPSALKDECTNTTIPGLTPSARKSACNDLTVAGTSVFSTILYSLISCLRIKFSRGVKDLASKVSDVPHCLRRDTKIIANPNVECPSIVHVEVL